MGRVIKDTVKSTSFPPVKDITGTKFMERGGFLGNDFWEEHHDLWESMSSDNWESEKYADSIAELSIYSSDTNLMRKWEERDVNWNSHEFIAAELEWNEDHGYVYKSQDTRRKFNFDPERLRVA